jgi:branched-chain amino acid transport system permease protein
VVVGSISYVVQNGIDAISTGSLYALFALGIALIFGIMQLINFAHGELIMIAGYSLFFALKVEWAFAIVMTLVVAIVFALLMERIAFRPVRGANPATLLVTSFGVSYFLQNLAIILFGSRPKSVGLPSFFTEYFSVGSIDISKLSVIVVCTVAGLLVTIALFLKRSLLGISMRGAAEDFLTTRLLGVRSNVVIATAFAISGLLAAVAALLIVAQLATLQPTMGVNPVIFAFIATVIGGMGSLPGAVLGGFLLGIVQVTLQASLGIGTRPWRDAFLFGFVVLVLLLRPQGLLVPRTARSRI